MYDKDGQWGFLVPVFIYLGASTTTAVTAAVITGAVIEGAAIGAAISGTAYSATAGEKWNWKDFGNATGRGAIMGAGLGAGGEIGSMMAGQAIGSTLNSAVFDDDLVTSAGPFSYNWDSGKFRDPMKASLLEWMPLISDLSALHTALTTDINGPVGEYGYMDGEQSGTNIGGHAATRIKSNGQVIKTENIYPSTLDPGPNRRYPTLFEKVGATNRGNNTFFESHQVHILKVRRLNLTGIQNYQTASSFRAIGANCTNHAFNLLKSGGVYKWLPTYIMTPTLGANLLKLRNSWLNYYGM